MGLDKIIDFLLGIIDDLLPFFVVKEWERAVVLRFGKVHRVSDKGIHYKIPFVDNPITYEVVITTMGTPIQTLITSDNSDVTIQAVVKYMIKDVIAYTTEIYDATDAIIDITQGHIMTEVNSHTYDECRDTSAMGNTIAKKVRADVKRYGVYIDQVTLTNFTKTRNYRLFKNSESEE